MDVADTAAIATPIGTVRLTGFADRLTTISIDTEGPECDGSTALMREAAGQLRAYFAGTLERFDLPLALASTARGEQLRAALLSIPLGVTVTYGEIARTHASSARAIGGVCRTNAFPIVVPCHRVVSAGKTDYYSAGAGPVTKAWLLTHERDWRR